MTEPGLPKPHGGTDQLRRLSPGGRVGPAQESRSYRSSAARAAARWRREHGLNEPTPALDATDPMVVGIGNEVGIWAATRSGLDRIFVRLRRPGRQ